MPVSRLRFSHLKAMGRSPAHCAELRQRDIAPTSAMSRGSAVHALVLGGPRVVAWEEGRQRRGKDFDAFAAANEDARILTAAEYETANRMAEAVKKNVLAMAVLGGVREQTIHWTARGIECRGTPDAAEYSSHVADLKTTVTAEPGRFTWLALRAAYHAQLAWYMDGIKAAGLGTPREAYVVAVEATRPHPVTVLHLTARALEQGRALYSSWLERYRQCDLAGQWPEYAQDLIALDVADEVELDFGEAGQ